jgi:uncharacterized membrane protein YbhN (UPF0104 family)
VQEIALSGALVGFGAPSAAAVATTLVYRSLTFLPSVVLGLAAVATYNLGKPRPRNAHLDGALCIERAQAERQ